MHIIVVFSVEGFESGWRWSRGVDFTVIGWRWITTVGGGVGVVDVSIENFIMCSSFCVVYNDDDDRSGSGC